MRVKRSIKIGGILKTLIMNLLKPGLLKLMDLTVLILGEQIAPTTVGGLMPGLCSQGVMMDRCIF